MIPQRAGGTRSLSRDGEEIHATAANKSILLITTSRRDMDAKSHRKQKIAAAVSSLLKFQSR